MNSELLARLLKKGGIKAIRAGRTMSETGAKGYDMAKQGLQSAGGFIGNQADDLKKLWDTLPPEEKKRLMIAAGGAGGLGLMGGGALGLGLSSLGESE